FCNSVTFPYGLVISGPSARFVSGADCWFFSALRLGGTNMSMTRIIWRGLLATTIAVTAASTQAYAQQQQRPPNILVIMGDDVGWFNIGAYHQGIMSGKTPNLDRLAAAGQRFF